MTISPRWEFAANAPTVGRICLRHDRIALPIELAVALPRHQILRATIEGSYGLLSDGVRRVSPVAAVSAGGWTLEAAEQIAN